MTAANNKNPKAPNDKATEQPGGTDPAAAPQGDPAPGDTQAEGEGDSGNTPALYKPDGIPDHLVGETNEQTIDGLLKAYSGAREALSKGKNVPAKPEDYKLDLPAELAEKILSPGEDGKDPVLTALQPIFHKHNIPQEAYQDLIVDVYKRVAEMAAEKGEGQGEGEGGLDFEFTSMGGVEKVKPIQDGVNARITGLKNQGKLDDDDVNELRLLTIHPNGLKLANKLMAAVSGEKAIPMNLDRGSDGGELTEAELNKRVNDPRYRRSSKEYDPAFYKETEKMFQDFYNKKPA